MPKFNDTEIYGDLKVTGKVEAVDLEPVYGYSTTAQGTAAKSVSATASATPFQDYQKGRLYVIEFSAGNTATTPTININGKGAKTVHHITTNGGTTTSPVTNILYSRTRFIVTFVYDGTNMIPIGVANRYGEVNFAAYTKAGSASAITTSDTVLGALGKLEYKVDNAGGGGLNMTFLYSTSVASINPPNGSLDYSFDLVTAIPTLGAHQLYYIEIVIVDWEFSETNEVFLLTTLNSKMQAPIWGVGFQGSFGVAYWDGSGYVRLNMRSSVFGNNSIIGIQSFKVWGLA